MTICLIILMNLLMYEYHLMIIAGFSVALFSVTLTVSRHKVHTLPFVRPRKNIGKLTANIRCSITLLAGAGHC